MKKLNLIYNPESGSKSFKDDIDNCLKVFQYAGYYVSIFRISSSGQLDEYLQSINEDNCDVIVVSGGDGTINSISSYIVKNNLNIPMGIIPSGTANDVASFLGIPTESVSAAKLIANGNIKSIDMGMVNQKYFVNVCAIGLFTNVSQNIDPDFKNRLGKLAYYIDGVKQMPNFEPISLKITNSKGIIKDDFYLFMALNSSGTGGFKKLSINAQIDDGMLDFVGFKATSLIDFAKLFLKVLSGEYLNEPKILFFKDNYAKIEVINHKIKPLYLKADVDGEEGPSIPLEIKCIKHKLNVFVPKSFN